MASLTATALRTRARYCVQVIALMATVLVLPSHAADQDLIQYAKECEQQIAAVPNFSCLNGTEVPMVGKAGQDCDTPPYLPEAGCYPYSRIGEIATGNKDVGIVFMCRHKEPQPKDSNKWQDIAVIQTNFRTGATCFFQQLSKNSTLSGEVIAPSTGDTKWITPKTMASEGNACVQCHDSGAFLRTPYLKSVISKLAAFQNFRARGKTDREKYWFPGSQFLFYAKGKNWNGAVHRVADTSAGNACTQCHEMGTNTIDKTFGTSLWLGPYAAGVEPTPDLQNGFGPHGDIAYWMKPNLSAPDQSSKDHATTMRECALLPGSSGTCTQIPFDGQITELSRLAHDALSQSVLPADSTKSAMPVDPEKDVLPPDSAKN